MENGICVTCPECNGEGHQPTGRPCEVCDGMTYVKGGTLSYRGPSKVFLIDDGECHWIAALSEDDAYQYHAVECAGYQSIDEFKAEMNPEIKLIHPARTIGVKDMDDEEKPTEYLSACEWAERTERGCFASTVY